MDNNLDDMATLIGGLNPDENARLVKTMSEISVEMNERGIEGFTFDDMLSLIQTRHAVIHGDPLDMENVAFHLAEKAKANNTENGDDAQPKKELDDYVTSSLAMDDNRPPVTKNKQIEVPPLNQAQMDSLNAYELIEYSRGHVLPTAQIKIDENK